MKRFFAILLAIAMVMTCVVALADWDESDDTSRDVTITLRNFRDDLSAEYSYRIEWDTQDMQIGIESLTSYSDDSALYEWDDDELKYVAKYGMYEEDDGPAYAKIRVTNKSSVGTNPIAVTVSVTETDGQLSEIWSTGSTLIAQATAYGTVDIPSVRSNDVGQGTDGVAPGGYNQSEWDFEYSIDGDKVVDIMLNATEDIDYVQEFSVDIEET